MRTYKIVRLFFNRPEKPVIKTNLTLDQAQQHCQDPETSSSTCTKAKSKRLTETRGPWFDAYYLES